MDAATVGVFGGTGLYRLLDGARTVSIDTPYGAPSDAITLGEIGGIPVAFLPRHGADHRHPPHRIPYRANLWAMHELGVTRIVSPCAAGSLQPHVEPGDLVVPDQLVDRTWGRASTFFDGPETVHVSFADPYCPELRPLAVDACRATGARVHDGGTTVVIQGPRFSTRAESRWFAAAGWEVINMTQLPEAILARELEICFVNVAVITDHDVGVEGEGPPVTHREVLERFTENLDRLRDALHRLVPRTAATPRACPCARARQDAVG